MSGLSISRRLDVFHIPAHLDEHRISGNTPPPAQLLPQKHSNLSVDKIVWYERQGVTAPLTISVKSPGKGETLRLTSCTAGLTCHSWRLILVTIETFETIQVCDVTRF
jgi:hypothetical protein